MFHNFNSYPHWFITKVVNEVNNDFKQIVPPTPHIETTDGENNNIKKPMMILPYPSEKKSTLIKFLKKNLQRELLINIQARIVYTGTKLSFQLKNMKDPKPSEEQHDIVYHSFCSAEKYKKDKKEKIKNKYARGNQMLFMTKELLKEIMLRSRLRNKFLIDKTDEHRFLYAQQMCCSFEENQKDLL